MERLSNKTERSPARLKHIELQKGVKCEISYSNTDILATQVLKMSL